jgi:hypothetical protein
MDGIDLLKREAITQAQRQDTGSQARVLQRIEGDKGAWAQAGRMRAR